jgi:hypothetical protein
VGSRTWGSPAWRRHSELSRELCVRDSLRAVHMVPTCFLRVQAVHTVADLTWVHLRLLLVVYLV